MDEKEINKEIHQHREEKEIVRKYELLKKESSNLVNAMNDNWVEQEKLRAEYQTLTGKDIAERHKTR